MSILFRVEEIDLDHDQESPLVTYVAESHRGRMHLQPLQAMDPLRPRRPSRPLPVYSSRCIGVQFIDVNASAGSTMRGDNPAGIVGGSRGEEHLKALGMNVAVLLSRRHSAVVVHRGTPNSPAGRHFAAVVLAMVHAAAAHVDRALQIVADEKAKEQQLQRLLHGEENVGGGTAAEEGDASARDPGSTPLASPSQYAAATSPRAPTVAGDQSMGTVPRLCLPTRPVGSVGRRTASTARDSRFTVLTNGVPQGFAPPPVNMPCLSARPPPKPVSRSRARPARKVQESKSRLSLLLRRKTSIGLLQQLSENVTPPSELQGNGWGSHFRHLSFNGYSSYIVLPAIPQLEKVVKGFTIDFWLKTDCRRSDGRRTLLFVGEGTRHEIGMQLHVGLNWYPEQEEGVRLYIRDSTNRVLECIVPFRGSFVTTGQDFHHILIRVRSAEGGLLDAIINGEPVDRIQLLQTEHPTSFNTWIHRVVIGAFVDEYGAAQQCLRGSLCDLRIRQGVDERPVVRWPLNGPLSSFGTLREVTGAVPDDHTEMVHEVRETLAAVPTVCPMFDRLCVNLGTLGPLGEFLQNWSVEVRFRTAVTSRCMSLIGVTDSQLKMQEFGIVLNAEPTSGKERYRYHELHVTFFLVDCMGNCVSALLRGSDRSNLMDGRWHTIHFKVIDAESNRMDVRVDGQLSELIPVCRESPRVFVRLWSWVCIGAHNVRNWKLRNAFSGYINKVAFQIRGEFISHLGFHEGPGARILLDESGRGHHGVLQLLDSRMTRTSRVRSSEVAHAVLWVHQDDNDDVAARGSLPSSDVVVHTNNAVLIGIVRFAGEPCENNVVEERARDMITGSLVDIDVDAPALCATPRPIAGPWASLPTACMHPVESMTHLYATIAEALRECRDEDDPAHTLVVLGVGDSRLAALSLSGPHVFRGTPTFNPNECRWLFGNSTDGLVNHKRNVANNMAWAVDCTLREVTLMPHLAIRLGTRSLPCKKLSSAVLRGWLEDQGLPWRLASVMHGFLLNPHSHVAPFFVQSLIDRCGADEAASATLYYRLLNQATMPLAAIVIQRNYRGYRSLKWVRVLQQERLRRNQRVEAILDRRRTDPSVLPKRLLRALVITMHQLATHAVPILSNPLAADIAEGLRKQGYVVEVMTNPNKLQLIKALSSLNPDTSNFVYISGYGGSLRLRQPPELSLDLLLMQLTESTEREATMAGPMDQWREMRMTFLIERREILQREASSKKKKKRVGYISSRVKAKMQQDAVAQQRLQEEEARMAMESLVWDEAEARARLLLRDEEIHFTLLLAAIRSAWESLVAFASVYGNPAKQPSTIVPSDCPHMEPFVNDVINVEEAMSRCMQGASGTSGIQCVLAMDLTPLGHSTRGLAAVVSSTGHRFSFPYLPGQRSLLSWTLRKALEGHVPRVPIKLRDALLVGAAESVGSQRDWRSFATYVVAKLVPLTKANPAPFQRELEREVAYVADVLPLRVDPLGDEGRAKQRTEREVRRVHCEAKFAADASSSMYDIMHELHAGIQSTTFHDVVAQPRVLLQFISANRGIAGLDMAVVQREVGMLVPKDIVAGISPTPDGLWISLSHLTDGATSSLTHTTAAIVGRAATWRMSTLPYSAVKELLVDRVMVEYVARGSMMLGTFRRLQRELFQKPHIGPHCRFLSCALD